MDRMEKLMRRRSVLLGAAAASLAAPALAQQFPSKPVRVVVPYTPGGGADTTARLIAPKLQDALGQTVVIDNKPGAGGTIGDDAVAKAAPDGHTLLIGAFAHAVNPSLMPKMPFRTPDDFAPVSLLVTVPELLVVTPSFPAQTVAELVAMAKAQPGKLSYASSGNGSAQISPPSFSSCAPAPTSSMCLTRAAAWPWPTSPPAMCRSISAI
jgi:tripartite-type tricarboxylate transporter receptor subunit TctC